MTIDYRILGPLEVLVDHQAVKLGGIKEQSVLVILLLHANQVVSSDRLIDLLWGEQAPPKAGNTLQAYVSRLRKSLHSGGDVVLVTERPGYILKVADGAIDAERFAEGAAEGQLLLDAGRPEEAAAVLAEALEMWRGPALAAFEFYDFAVLETNRLNELRLSTLEARIAADLENGRHVAVIPDLERLTEEYPLRERLWASLMLALYRDGRQADALRAYQAARRGLGEELGIEPSAELIELEDRILRQDPDLLPAGEDQEKRAGNLPAEMTSFVGREEDVAALEELIGTARLVSLLGTGGVGKTRLAIWVARLVERSFPAGAWVVDLSGVSHPKHVSAEVASVLGGGPDHELSALLHDKEMLLVLDNCEAVVEGAADLAEEILAGSPTVKIIATSREPLQVRGEVLWRVNPLAVPDASGDVSPSALAAFEAIRLFAERGSASDPAFELDDDDVERVGRICRLLDGVPLAIELAAARVRHMTLAEIEAGLDDRFALLIGGTRRTPQRHRALEAAIEWSHEQLDPDEREMFERLAVFSLEFPLAAAEVVCSGDGIEVGEIRDLLARLSDKSLLIREERGGRTWYQLLDTVHEFAFVRVASRRLHHHARGFVVGLAQRTDPRLRGPEEQMWASLLGGDPHVSNAALEVAASSFREDQGAFLAGVAAARTTRTGRVGFLGGMTPEHPGEEVGRVSPWQYEIRVVMARFRDGYLAGVEFADPEVAVEEVYLTEEVDMATAFANPALGREVAHGLYARGADVVLHAAGGSGARIFEAARRASEDSETHRWGIGVDRDQFLTEPEALRAHVLSSVVKQLPIEVFAEIKAAVQRGAESAAPHFDVGNEGVLLSMSGGNLEAIQPELETLRNAIGSGEIDVRASAGH